MDQSTDFLSEITCNSIQIHIWKTVGYIDEGVMWKISVSIRVQILTQSSAQENILCDWVK